MPNFEDSLIEMARQHDREDRALFCECINKLFDQNNSGPHLRVTFVDNIETEDVLIVQQNDSFWIINTHMNSMAATLHCLAEWVIRGDCSGFNNKVYFANTLPEPFANQLKEKGWL